MDQAGQRVGWADAGGPTISLLREPGVVLQRTLAKRVGEMCYLFFVIH
jgi:hypothetical protein